VDWNWRWWQAHHYSAIILSGFLLSFF